MAASKVTVTVFAAHTPANKELNHQFEITFNPKNGIARIIILEIQERLPRELHKPYEDIFLRHKGEYVAPSTLLHELGWKDGDKVTIMYNKGKEFRFIAIEADKKGQYSQTNPNFFRTVSLAWNFKDIQTWDKLYVYWYHDDYKVEGFFRDEEGTEPIPPETKVYALKTLDRIYFTFTRQEI